MSPTVRGPGPETHAARGLQRWLAWHAVALIVGACGAAALSQGAFLAVPALVSFVALWRRRPVPLAALRRGFGLANGLTASRLLVVLLATASMSRLEAHWVIAAFSFNVAVDALDGYSARRLGEATAFGAVFDREVDALFVLSAYLYFCFYPISGFGAWVLLPGLLPYLYRLSVTMLSEPVVADAKERFAAPLAGLNFILLLGAMAVPGQAAPLLGLSVLVVLLSFGTSFWNLCRHAHSFS